MQNNPWEPLLDGSNKHYFEHRIRNKKLTPETEIQYREYILSGTIGDVYAAFVNEIDSLRNVIESQNSQIESLKAITELAVKRLKEIQSITLSSNPTRGFLMQNIVDISETVADTLSEIDRLSHD